MSTNDESLAAVLVCRIKRELPVLSLSGIGGADRWFFRAGSDEWFPVLYINEVRVAASLFYFVVLGGISTKAMNWQPIYFRRRV